MINLAEDKPMDAAQKLVKNSALLLISALLVAAPGWCAALPTLQVPASVSVTYTGSATVQATSSDGTTAIPFTIGTPNYGAGVTGWLSASGDNGNTTPSNLTFRVQAVAGLTACTSATVTLTPTGSGAYSSTAQTITVTWANTSSCPGSGGGSTTLTANPTSLNLTNTLNSSPVTISTASATALNLSAPVTAVSTSTGGINWLSASLNSASVVLGAPVTLTVTATATGLTYGQAYAGTVTVTPSTGTALVIPVNFAVGTTNSPSWTVTSANPVNLSFTTNSGTYPTSSITLTTTSLLTTYNVSVTSTGDWLRLNWNGPTVHQSGAQYTSVSSYPVGGTGAVLGVGTNANSLTAGVYQGYANITDSNNNPVATMTVNLTANGGTGSSTWRVKQNL